MLEDKVLARYSLKQQDISNLVGISNQDYEPPPSWTGGV